MLEINKIYNMDCLEGMKLIDDNSIDLIVTDPPYGTTACKWDSVIPFEPMWKRLKKVRKDKTPIVLFGAEPFSSYLRMSNIKEFKYDWIWKKEAGSNFATVKYQPMKEHENISIFCPTKTIYNPIMQERIGSRKEKDTTSIDSGRKNSVYGTQKGGKKFKVGKLRNPSSVQYFNRERGLHPTQKPVALLEYLIKTYTNENDLVLDFTIGSGTTAVACIKTNRNFIGFELDKKYFNIAQARIKRETAQVSINENN